MELDRPLPSFLEKRLDRSGREMVVERDHRGWFNATAMCQSCGKAWNEFKDSKGTSLHGGAASYDRRDFPVVPSCDHEIVFVHTCERSRLTRVVGHRYSGDKGGHRRQ